MSSSLVGVNCTLNSNINLELFAVVMNAPLVDLKNQIKDRLLWAKSIYVDTKKSTVT